MTTAYMAEVDTTSGTRFIGAGGSLVLRPKMFSSGGAMLRALLRFEKYYKDLREKVNVIVVRDLEKGIRASSADIKSTAEFKMLVASKTPRQKDLPNAQYKIQLGEKFGKMMYGKDQGPGTRYGKVWDTAGDVRRFIAKNLNLLASHLLNATVIEFDMQSDSLTPRTVKRMPIVEFYRGSPDSAARYQRFFSTSLSHDLPTPRSTLA